MALVFVYNADGGLVNSLLDWTHKTFSPGTYACNLCALTYSPFGMRQRWQDFLATLGEPVEFLHRDELSERYGLTGVPLPAVFRRMDERLEPWLDVETINGVKSLEVLERLIRERLS